MKMDRLQRRVTAFGTSIPLKYVTRQPNGTTGHSCAGQPSRFVECLESLDLFLRRNDTHSRLCGSDSR